MLDLTNRHLVRRGTNLPIIKWEVWFQCPFGIDPDLETVVKRCLDAEIDPEINVVPVPVAVASDGTNEVFYLRR